MKARLSRLFFAGGQNAVPITGWFFAGWTPGTTLAIFWFENLVLSLLIAARIAAHWSATRTRGHMNGFLRNFLTVSMMFTLVHGVFLAFILVTQLSDTVHRDDLIAGLQWMLAVQVAALALDLWSIGRWPFAELKKRTDWMLGRVVMVHLSILLGMFLFAWLEQPWWFFSVFVTLKAMLDIGSLLPQWEPNQPPAWLARTMNRIPKSTSARGPKDETFEEYWARTNREEAAQRTRDEEVVGA
jgi:hypothetical protein